MDSAADTFTLKWSMLIVQTAEEWIKLEVNSSTGL